MTSAAVHPEIAKALPLLETPTLFQEWVKTTSRSPVGEMSDDQDCPLYHFLQEHGIKVVTVGEEDMLILCDQIPEVVNFPEWYEEYSSAMWDMHDFDGPFYASREMILYALEDL